MLTEELVGLGDSELADAVRSGHVEAYAVLWDRHVAAGRAAARRLTSSYDPDDVVQEAYLRILRSLQLGSGPTGPFRPYLYTTLRAVVATWSRTPAPIPVDEVPDGADGTDVPATVLDRSMTAKAFRELPERWRSVLWYTEVEDMGAREVGTLLGLSPAATATLAYRAREGFRRAWLQAHVSADGLEPECRWTVEHLGDHARGTLSQGTRERVEAHLAGCLSCSVLAEEVADVASRLRGVLLPLVLGVPATVGAVVAPAAPGSAATVPSTGTASGASVSSATTASGASATTASGASVTSAVAGAGSTTAAVSTLAGVAGAAAAVGTPGALAALVVAGAVALTVGLVAIAQPWAAPDAVPSAPPGVVAAEVDDGEGTATEGASLPEPAPTGDEAPGEDVGDAEDRTEPAADDPVPAGVLADGDAASPAVARQATETPVVAVPEEPVRRPAPSEPVEPQPEPSGPDPSDPAEPQPEPPGPEPAPEPSGEPTATPEPTPEPTPGPTVEPTPEPTPEPMPSPGPTPGPTPVPEPEPSEPPVVESAPLVVTTAPPAGRLTVYPVVRGTGEPGALVRVSDARADVVASATVGTDGRWEVAVTDLAAAGEHTLHVVQVEEGETSAPATVGPYVFDVPRVLSPAPGEVVVGLLDGWSWSGPRYATEVVLDGTPGLRVEAFVDGRPTGTVHTLGDEPLVRQVRDLPTGAHTFALRVVDRDADGPGYGPTVTVPFTLVGLL